MGRTITIHLGPADQDLKQMINELRRHQGNNEYCDRSESVVAKMLLREVLPREHRRICGGNGGRLSKKKGT